MGLLSLGVNAVFAYASSLSPNAVALVVFRIFAGLGVGGSVPSVFTLAAELVPTQSRGAFMNAVAACWMVGAVYAAGLAWLMLEIHPVSWRWFAAATARA